MTTQAHRRLFGSVVWATDGSASSSARYAYVRDLCERYGSTLRVVHIARPLATRDEERRIAKLKAITSALRRRGVDASLHVVRAAIGSPARHITEVARMVDADLILVTTRGRSPAASALGGSVTQRLLATSPCPILIVHRTKGGTTA